MAVLGEKLAPFIHLCRAYHAFAFSAGHTFELLLSEGCALAVTVKKTRSKLVGNRYLYLMEMAGKIGYFKNDKNICNQYT
jgi:hypothetical protein